MKVASDYRRIARTVLCGKWRVAILTGFIASLMGAGIATGGGSSNGSSETSSGTIFGGVQNPQLWGMIQAFVAVVAIVLVIWLLVTLVLGGAGKLGYAVFNLKLVDQKEVAVSDLFSQFHRLGAGFCMNLLMGLFTFLWSLLFVIPGIIKGLSYAMTPYILAEHPEMTANEAITASRRVMDGNKWRLFCLSLSFIGWWLLCAAPSVIAVAVLSSIAAYAQNLDVLFWLIPCCLPSFVGALFVMPYQEAAHAAFYRDISGTAAAPEYAATDYTTYGANDSFTSM